MLPMALGELRREMRRHGGFHWWMIPWWVYAVSVGAVLAVVFLVWAVVDAALRPPPPDPWGQPAVSAP